MYYTGPSGNSVKSSYHYAAPTPQSFSSGSGSHSGRVGSFASNTTSVPPAIKAALDSFQRNISPQSSAHNTSKAYFGASTSGSVVSTPGRVASTSGRAAFSNPTSVSSYYSGTSGAPSAAALDYLNADLAKYYGMDQTTAYNEALANTSYQRAVRDMQAAGLNPAVLFGNGRVSGADGVYGAKPLAAVTGASYGSSGGSSGSGRSYGSGRSSGKLFSKNAYGMIAGLGGLAGAGIAAATGGSIGLGALTGTTIATSAAKVLNGIFR